MTLSPLSVGSGSGAEQLEEILNYYHVLEKSGGFDATLLGLNVGFLTVLLGQVASHFQPRLLHL